MLKRLSFTSDSATPFLAPPTPGARTPNDSSPNPRSTSPSYPFPPTPTGAQVERTTLHKSLTSLSALLVALDEYRSLVAGLARAERKVGKLSRELGGTFRDKVEGGARSEVVVNALGAGAGMYEALAGVDTALAKVVQREYEAVNDVAGKFFKKVAKEEKGFDDALAAMDAKVQKATSAYEKSRPRARPSLADASAAAVAHDKYMASLSSLSSSTATLKKSHAENMGDKREKAGKEVARIVCGLAEAGWKNRVEGTRRGGEKAGEVVARGVWCETGMPAVALEDVYSDVEQQHQQAQEQQQAQQQQQQSTFRGPRPLPSTHDSFVHPQQVFPTSACPPSNDHPTQQLSSSTQSLLPPSSPNQPFASSSQPVSPTSSAPPSPRELPTRQLESSPEPQPQRILSRKPSTSSLVSHQSTFSSRPPARPPTDLEPPRPTFAQFEPPPSPSAILKSLETQRVPSPQPVRIVAAGRRRGDSDDRSTTRNFSSDEEAMRGEERKGAWREEADPRRSVAREGPEQMGRRYNGKEGVKRNESTASERSFVARMRERYVEEQERERQEGKKTVERRPELPAPIPRSNSRVADLAQRYTSPPSSDYAPPHQSFPSSSSSGLPRPSHRYSHSMQPLQSTDSTGFNEFGQRGAGASTWTESRDASTTYGSPPPTSRPPYDSGRHSYDSRSYSRPPLDPAPQYARSNRSTSRQEEAHPDCCGCEKCSKSKYKERGTTREEEERRQKELRSVGRMGNERRMSMPVVFGGGRR